MKAVSLILFVIFSGSCELFGQNTSRITGVVVDEKNKPMKGAYVHIKNQLRNTHADKQGVFELWVSAGTMELMVTVSGYEEYSEKVTLTENAHLDVDTIRLKKLSREQSPDKKDENKNGKFDQLIVNAGVQQGWRTTGQFSIGICDQKFRFKKIMPLWHLRQIHVGGNFVIRENPILGPKISYDATADGWSYLSLLTYGIDGIYYFDNRYSGIYINPHFGLTAFSFYNILIGYNIPLQKTEMNNLVNGLHVTLNIPLFGRRTDKTLK